VPALKPRQRLRGNTIAGFQSEPKLTDRSRSEDNFTVDPFLVPVKGKFGTGTQNLNEECRGGSGPGRALTPAAGNRNVSAD